MVENSSNSKKSLVFSVIAIIALITIIAGATFAFFASTQDINANLPTNITTAAKTYTFIASSDGEINFYLSAQDMSEDNVNENYIMTDNGLINVEVASANDGEITRCTYDIAWVWDSDNKYTTPDVELPYEKDGITYPYELSVSVDGKEEKDLSSFSLDSNNSFIIATGLTSMATSTTPVIDSHKIEVKAYNIPIDQQNLFNKSFQAHMEVRNVNCGVLTVDGDIAILSSGTFYNSLNASATSAAASNFKDTDNTQYSGKVVSENGIRYEGKNPNNYVSFNDELWRIIGVFDENTHGRSGEQLVKLIRAEQLPQYYQWDSNNVNNWNNATLKTTLNTNYYNNANINACSNYGNNTCTATTVIGEGIKTDEVRNMIQPIQWKIGGHNNYETASVMYEKERGITTAGSSGATAVTTETLPIGLIYPSDYGYAVQVSDCARTINLYDYDSTATCHTENWLFNVSKPEDTWLLSPNSGTSYRAWIVSSTGFISFNYGSNYTYVAVPVLYLKQNIQITGGLGTKTNPYTIA